MRPVLAIGVVVFILGGLQLYMQARKHFGPPPAMRVERPAPGVFNLKITLTFDAAASSADPFALRLEDSTDPVLLVMFRGQTLLERTASIEAGQTVVVETIKNVVVGQTSFEGRNELFIRVRPADLLSQHPHAVHVSVTRDGIEMANQTVWGKPREIVEGIVVFEIVGASPDDHENQPQPASPR